MTITTITQATGSFTNAYDSYNLGSWNVGGLNNVGMLYTAWFDFGAAGIPKDAVINSALIQPYLGGGAGASLLTPSVKLFDTGSAVMPVNAAGAVAQALTAGSTKAFAGTATGYLDWDIKTILQGLVNRVDWTLTSSIIAKFDCTDAGSNYFAIYHPNTAYGGLPSKITVDWQVGGGGGGVNKKLAKLGAKRSGLACGGL